MDTTALATLPQVDLTPIVNSNKSEATKTKYIRAVTRFIDAGGDITDPLSLATHAQDLPGSSRAFLKAAIRLLTEGAALKAKASATPENIDTIQASLYRIEALQKAIQVKAPKGVKAHTWLSQYEVKTLMSTCADTLEGRRDWIVLGLLLGAGLRREELADVKFTDLIEQPTKNGKKRVVLSVQGKGAKNRLIPINPILAERIRAWDGEIGDGGLIVRSLGRKRVIGASLSTIGIFGIVRKHGAMIGKPELDPHDLRRTYAQLGYEAGIPLTQISMLLGHSSLDVTKRYLNLELNLETTISDFIPLE